MAVKIRLARAGAKKAPFYRIVAADSRARRDGRFIEILGRYNPRTEPSFIEMDVEKVSAWVSKGAQMSETVTRLYNIASSGEAPKAPEGKTRMSKKAQAREAEATKAAEAAKAAAAAPAPSDESQAPEAEASAAEEAAEESEPAADESTEG